MAKKAAEPETKEIAAPKKPPMVMIRDGSTVVWYIDGEESRTEIAGAVCPFCHKAAIAELPPALKAQQPDGTTHVCHPLLDGCNHGFAQS